MKNRDIKRFLIACAIVLSSLFVIDRGVGVVCNYALSHIENTTSELGRTNYVLNQLNDKDIIFFGSSRAQYHYVPEVFENLIKAHYHTDSKSVYNAGFSGHFVSFNICCVESVVRRYTPKLILLEISSEELYIDFFTGRAVTQLMPYSSSCPVAREYIDSKGLKAKIQTRINTFVFNGKFLQIIKAFLTGKTINDGYVPLHETMQHIPEAEFEEEAQLDYDVIEELHVLLSHIAAENINCVIVSSPKYRVHDDRTVLADICAQHNIPYINMFENDYFNNHPELFKDQHHLNDDGARLYTSLLFEELVSRNLINNEIITDCKSVVGK